MGGGTTAGLALFNDPSGTMPGMRGPGSAVRMEAFL